MPCLPPSAHWAVSSGRTSRAAPGFTLPELLIVMILAGILAAVVLPKMDAVMGIRSDNWRDQVSAAVRYGQKVAVSHRRLVCMTVSGTSITLSIAATRGSTSCTSGTNDLPGPDGSSVFARSGSTSVTVSVTPSSVLYFQADGRVTSDAAGNTAPTHTFVFPGAQNLILYGETGYVQ